MLTGTAYAAKITQMRPPAREFGGPVNRGSPFLVGERGPELFVPNQSGDMVSNNELGGGQVVNININAVDAPSFDTLLIRRRGLLVGLIRDSFDRQTKRLA